MKKHRVLLIFALILISILIALHLATPIMRIGLDDTTVPVSKNYSFHWNKWTKYATLSKDSQKLYSFFIKQRPLAAWILEKDPQPQLAIITSTDDTLGSQQVLMQYDGKTLQTIFPQTFSGEPFQLYLSHSLYLQNPLANSPVVMSPTGELYFLRKYFPSKKDSYYPILFHRNESKEIQSQPYSQSIQWSPNGRCFFDSDQHTLGKVTEKDFRSRWFETEETAGDHDIQLLWKSDSQNCEGFFSYTADVLGPWLVLVEKDKHFAYTFKFTDDQNATMSAVPTHFDTTGYIPSKEYHQEIIFYTEPKSVEH